MKPQIVIKKDEIFINGNNIYFYQGKDVYFKPKDIEIKETESGYIFTLSSILPTAMVVPCLNRHVIIGDNYDYFNSNVIFEYYYKGPTQLIDNKNCIELYYPGFHLVFDDAWTFSVYGECRLSYFYKSYQNYISIMGVPNGEKIIFYLDVCSNYQVNFHRHPMIKRPNLNITSSICIEDMNNCLYYGIKTIQKQSNTESILPVVKNLQNILSEDYLTSVITGSVAEQLNGIDCYANDIDLMFKTRPIMIHASEFLKDLGFIVFNNNDKWIRLIKDDEIVDLSYDNYNLMQTPHYIKEINGLRFLDTNGLLWLCLLNEQEKNITQYRDSYIRNKKALFEISNFNKHKNKIVNSSIINIFDKHCELYSNLLELSEELSAHNQLFKDTKINDPFKVNCFGNESKRIFSIINLGNKEDFRVITDFKPKNAIWKDLSGKKENAHIQLFDNFSAIFCNSVEYSGILVCEK